MPQPHGGALNAGGTPGNVGNPNAPGRPPSAIRERCRGSFDQRVPVLEQIADGEIEGDRLKAVDLLGKYGLDSRTQGMSVDDVRERLRLTVAEIRAELGPVVAERLIGRIRAHWKAA